MTSRDSSKVYRMDHEVCCLYHRREINSIERERKIRKETRPNNNNNYNIPEELTIRRLQKARCK